MEFAMKIGKVPENVLKRSVFKQIHTKRPEVVLGAGVGEDCAAVKLAEDETLVMSTDPITGTAQDIGTLAIQITANDLASAGAAHCARGLHMAGPLERFNMRNWIAVLSVTNPIYPPKASISRTICPLAIPPTAGLQLICPILFMSIVIRQVFEPRFAAAAAASQPACPAPITITSYLNSIRSISFKTMQSY